jgi:hypothetical protein
MGSKGEREYWEADVLVRAQAINVLAWYDASMATPGPSLACMWGPPCGTYHLRAASARKAMRAAL